MVRGVWHSPPVEIDYPLVFPQFQLTDWFRNGFYLLGKELDAIAVHQVAQECETATF